MADEATRAHDIACAASNIVWGGELGWVRGDHKALIAKLHRLKVDSDNLRFLHEEVYPMLGWDGGDTPPLTFLQGLIDELSQLRATAEVVEKVSVATNVGMFIEKRLHESFWVTHHAINDVRHNTLLEALTALAAESVDGEGKP